jgi:hypothetical protein
MPDSTMLACMSGSASIFYDDDDPKPINLCAGDTVIIANSVLSRLQWRGDIWVIVAKLGAELQELYEDRLLREKAEREARDEGARAWLEDHEIPDFVLDYLARELEY